jgi:hypothetical protein
MMGEATEGLSKHNAAGDRSDEDVVENGAAAFVVVAERSQ